MKSLKDLVECNYKKEEEKFYSHEIEIENKTRKFHLFINLFQIFCNIIVLFLLGVLIDNLQKGTYLEWIFVLMIIIIMLPFCVWFSGNVLINTIKNIKENKMEDNVELGNLMFGNSRGEFLLKNRDLVNCEEWKNLLKLTNCDSYGLCDNETGEFDCEVFTIRPYYWGEDETEMDKPNFVYKPTNLTIDWYKYPFRDSYMNQNLSDNQLKEIWQKCIDFISDKETVELTNEEVEYLTKIKNKYSEKNICNLVKKLETIIEEKENDSDFKNMTCKNYNYGPNQKIQNLKQQLDKMGQEINIKNNKLSELKKELTICKDTLKRKTQSNRDLQHRVHNVNTEFAVNELEKVVIVTQWKFNNVVDVVNYIEERLKELRGE